MKQLLTFAALFLLAAPVQAKRMDLNCEDFMDDDLISLACNIYWEGRNQSYRGKLAIAAVTVWRVHDPKFPDTIAGVVWEKRWSKRYGRYYPQFQWTLDGKKDHPFTNESREWNIAMTIARMFAVRKEQKDAMCTNIIATHAMWAMLEERGYKVKRRPLECHAFNELMHAKLELLREIDPTDGSVMYHADYVAPGWMDAVHKVGAVGDHIFYRRFDQES